MKKKKGMKMLRGIAKAEMNRKRDMWKVDFSISRWKNIQGTII